MRTIGHLRFLVATGLLLGSLSLGCSGSTSPSKPDALSPGTGSAGQDGSANLASGGGNVGGGNTGAAGSGGGGTTGLAGNSAAGAVAQPQDGGAAGAMDAARDGNRDGVNDVPQGSNDAVTTDAPLDTGKNPDGTGDGARDRIPTADTRDGASATKDAPPDGSTPCGDCLLGLTCGGGGVPTQCGVTITPQHGKNCSIGGWCSEADRPSLSAIYARTADDIWAVGRAGQIAHFDGSVWTITSGVIQSHGIAEDLLGGPPQAFNDSGFTSVWASGPSDVWVTARGPGPASPTNTNSSVFLVLRGDGLHWNVVLTSVDPAFSYVGVWGTGPDNVWVAQQRSRQSTTVPIVPSVSHWDGAAWATLAPPDMIGSNTLANSGSVNAIWGLSANDIYLVCDYLVWRFDGTTWTPTSQGGQALWGTSASSLWLANRQNLFHSIGATWVQMKPPSGCGAGLWGTSDSSLWLGGCYYDGLKWTSLGVEMKAVHGPTATGAVGLATDEGLVNLTATTVTALAADVPAIVSNDIAGSGPNDLWIVGANADASAGAKAKARALHWDGTAFKVIDQASPAAFTTISVLPGNDVWAGDSSGLWQLSGSSFVASTGSPKGRRQQLWSPSKDAIWAVSGSDASISYFDGTTWQKLPHGLSASTVELASVWGSSTTDIWVAGSGGITEHWNGTSWTAYDAGTSYLFRVWGTSAAEVFVMGLDNNIHAWDGSRWAVSSTVTIGQSSVGDYRVCAANDIWATLTTRYTVLYRGSYSVAELGHFDGSTWHVYTTGELEMSPGFARVFCAAPGDTWMVYGGTAIRHLQTP